MSGSPRSPSPSPTWARSPTVPACRSPCRPGSRSTTPGPPRPKDYNGIIKSYRHGWDLIDVNDENDPGWAVPAGLTEQNLRAQERTFDEGVHTFVLKVRDDSNQEQIFEQYLQRGALRGLQPAERAAGHRPGRGQERAELAGPVGHRAQRRAVPQRVLVVPAEPARRRLGAGLEPGPHRPHPQRGIRQPGALQGGALLRQGQRGPGGHDEQVPSAEQRRQVRVAQAVPAAGRQLLPGGRRLHGFVPGAEAATT